MPLTCPVELGAELPIPAGRRQAWTLAVDASSLNDEQVAERVQRAMTLWAALFAPGRIGALAIGDPEPFSVPTGADVLVIAPDEIPTPPEPRRVDVEFDVSTEVPSSIPWPVLARAPRRARIKPICPVAPQSAFVLASLDSGQSSFDVPSALAIEPPATVEEERKILGLDLAPEARAAGRALKQFGEITLNVGVPIALGALGLYIAAKGFSR